MFCSEKLFVAYPLKCFEWHDFFMDFDTMYLPLQLKRGVKFFIKNYF